MNEVEARFNHFKINILKLSVLLTFFLGVLFFLFHLFFYKGKHQFLVNFVEFLLVLVSFFSYKFISEKNYKFYAVIEFFIILLTVWVLSIIYPNNVYLPIWMFGTLIVFSLCTDIVLGIIFLIISIIIFDFLFIKRINIYSFLTLNFQFIAYFIFGIILIMKIKSLERKTFFYENLLYKNSLIDHLTKLFNRKYFEKTAKILLEKANRNKTNVLFLMLDLDYFKKINDLYGHPVGDIVLINVANEIKNSIRKSDLLARMGGEEFAILIEDYNLNSNLAEKIRQNIEKLRLYENITVTISIGGVISKNYNYDYLYKKADEALYKAKKTRNKVVIFNEL